MAYEPEIDPSPGLNGEDLRNWPKQRSKDMPPIDFLRPGTDAHQKVLDYLKTRLELSEKKMSQFYPRWRANERKNQAYIQLPDYEQIMEAMNNEGKAPKIVSIQVPYMFATISTIVTYLLHAFCGRKPMLTVNSQRGDAVQAAMRMEEVLQYNNDHTNLIHTLFHFFNSTQIYGVGVMRTAWKNQYSLRTKIIKPPSMLGGAMSWIGVGSQAKRVRQQELVYSGNEVFFVDPFMFFPDPRVPMSDVRQKGEFVFWREFVGKHSVLKMEADGIFKWVNYAGKLPQALKFSGGDTGESDRSLRAKGQGHPGQEDPAEVKTYQLDQGTVEIVPAELGLGEGRRPEKWLFTIANKTQIIQAQPFEHDHDEHPIVCGEPYSTGPGFGHLGMSDLLGPIQDAISWLMNSHIYNVRASLNNIFVVDPSMIEMADLKNPEPGLMIRLKRQALGMDVRAALQQLQVADVTKSHVQDMQLFMEIGERLSAVTSNLMGIQDPGGRKTATEIRVSGDSAGSRLSAQTRILSAQAIVPLARQESLNIQQFMDPNFAFTLLGQKGDQLTITGEQLVGDFNFPVHDGTLPLDKVAMLDVWKEILLGVAQDMQLRSQFDITAIFEFVAQLGGAKNIEQFKIQMTPDQQIAEAVAGGNVVPLPQLGGPNDGPAAAAGGPRT